MLCAACLLPVAACSLTLTGGTFRPPTGSLLLGALAAACPQLEELRLLPEALCGLGDAEVDTLLQLRGLQARL